MRVKGRLTVIAVAALVAGGLSGPVAEGAPKPRAELIPAWDDPGPQRTTSFEGGPSTAESQRAALPWRCLLYVSDPQFVKRGGRFQIEGVGRQSCTGSGYVPQGPRLTLQRYLGFGVWRNVYRTSIAWSYGSFAEMRPGWACGGTGSEEYRWVVDGFAQGVPRVRAHAYSLRYLRVIC